MPKNKGLDVAGILKKVSKPDSKKNDDVNFLAQRLKTQKSRARGERQQKVVYKVDPKVCKIRDEHDRDYSKLTAENCSELIEGIKSIGQIQPALVIDSSDKDFTYEIVYGARRHFACSYLNTDLLVEIQELSEEEIFLISDEENRNRKDIADYERAVKYKNALDHYYESQKQMANKMGVNISWLSRLLFLGSIPKEIISCFASTYDINEGSLRFLKPYLGDKNKKTILLNAAKEMQKNPLPGKEVIIKLKKALIQDKKPRAKRSVTFNTKKGKQFMRARSGPSGVDVYIHTDVEATEDEILNAIKTLL